MEQPPTGGEVMDTEEGSAPSVTLGQILMSTKKDVSLEALGVKELRPRRAVTGALILEVPGENSAAGADKLAGKLRELLAGKRVRIGRPVKTEELRITGLDDSVSKEEVAEAIAAKTGCAESNVKIGEIRRSPSGLGSVWLRCPSAQAKKLADEGRLMVGWVAARVVALQPRRLHCFRCLEEGHTRSRCKAAVDRSGRCYRCGENGHTAGGCSRKLRCPLCSDLGKPNEHRFGGPACSSKRGEQVGRRRPPIEKAPRRKSGGGRVGTVPPPIPSAGKTQEDSPTNVQGSRSGSPYITGRRRNEEGLDSGRFFKHVVENTEESDSAMKEDEEDYAEEESTDSLE